MRFPELRSLLKRAFGDNAPISLNLKSEAIVFSFDTTNVGWYARNGYPQIYAMLSGGMSAWSGETVSLESALQNSIVNACNRIISESIGFLPASVMQTVGKEKRYATEKPMYLAMKNAPNAEMTAQEFKETITSHTVLVGGGFAKINRRSGTNVAIGLDLISPDSITPDREKNTPAKRLVYVLNRGTESEKTYTVVPGKPQDILHIRGLGWDGVRGYSVLQQGRQSIGTAIAAERNIGRFWANGGRVPYHLETDGKFKDDQDFQEFRAQWEATYSQPHKAPILENGIKLVTDGLSMTDAQANEFRQFMIPEICRWFSVSPHLVGDLSRATFSNIEHLALEFVKMTLSTWITRWEQAFWRCVLTPEEKAQGYYLKHNVNALLRGDFATRMQGYSIALQNGFENIDEVRELEDLNPLPNGAGETHRVQLNMQTVPGTGEPSIVEQGILARGTPSEPTSPQDSMKSIIEHVKSDSASQLTAMFERMHEENELRSIYRMSAEIPEGIETKRGKS